MHEETRVRGGEAVDILGRVDQPDELVLVEVVGQRELEQDAVHAVVGVQVADQLGELLRRHVAAGLVVERLDAHLGGVLALHAHVDGGGRVVADQDRREARLAVHRIDLALHLLAHLGGDRLAVDDLGAHGGRQPTRPPGCALAPLQRRVVRHQLALGAVAREAHDHEAAGLDAHDHAVAELRVHHVVAEREGGAPPPAPPARAPPRRRPRWPPRPGPVSASSSRSVNSDGISSMKRLRMFQSRAPNSRRVRACVR